MDRLQVRRCVASLLFYASKSLHLVDCFLEWVELWIVAFLLYRYHCLSVSPYECDVQYIVCLFLGLLAISSIFFRMAIWCIALALATDLN
ncbi:hypothetical protein K474DRAFT_97875 [Panus rudis PR-1116 ss-1]|nr:hypothetical protein K474DRAFT_97875 [Panus rudis PR-1116 ss-1]